MNHYKAILFLMISNNLVFMSTWCFINWRLPNFIFSEWDIVDRAALMGFEIFILIVTILVYNSTGTRSKVNQFLEDEDKLKP